MLHYNISLLSKWWFAILGIGLFFFAVPVSMGQAIIGSGDITFTTDVTLNITVNGSSTNLIIPGGSTANEVIVNASSVEITKGSEGHISINSPGRLNLENDKNLQTACDGNQSKLTITIETKVIITPTSASDHCAAVLLGGGSAGGGGTSGGGGTGGGSGGVSTPSILPGATTPPDTTTPPTEQPPAEEPTVDFKDIKKLTEKEQANIVELFKAMLKQYAAKMPANKKYYPNNSARGDFSISTWNTVAGIGCGSQEKFPGNARCKKEAVKAGLLPDDFIKTPAKFKAFTRVTRLQNYEVLLKARKIPLEQDFSADDLKEVCSDVKKASKKMARVFFTARKYGIAVKYKGNRCSLNSSFKKKEAPRFALKALMAEPPPSEE